jgi:hypothetical protein
LADKHSAQQTTVEIFKTYSQDLVILSNSVVPKLRLSVADSSIILANVICQKQIGPKFKPICQSDKVVTTGGNTYSFRGKGYWTSSQKGEFEPARKSCPKGTSLATIQTYDDYFALAEVASKYIYEFFFFKSTNIFA